MEKGKKRSYRNYLDFINSHKITNNETNLECTNTRIPSKGVAMGGKYYISDEEYPLFLELYNRDIVSKDNDEFLTEKQRLDDGPIAIDCDFRYTYETTEKQYNIGHVKQFVNLYTNLLKEVLQFEEQPFQIYIFEKDSVNRLEDKQITKDGVHIIFGIQLDRAAQIIMRNKIIENLDNIWGNIPIINTWEDVLDKGICEGGTNWQLYGSSKPGHEKYKLTNILEYEYDSEEDDFIVTDIDRRRFNWTKDFAKLSVRYKDHPQFFYKADFLNVMEEFKNTMRQKPARIRSPKASTNNLPTNKEELETQYNEFLEHLSPADYELHEIADLVMVLPECFYGNGSYDRWIRVGWALRNTSQRLLIVWLMFCARYATFDFSNVYEICDKWSKFNTEKECDGFTKRSIIYWAKEYNPEGYKRIHETSVDFYLNQSIKSITLQNISKSEKSIGCGDADIAKILHVMFKDRFACAGLKNDKWYRFHCHRWVEDELGTSLRKSISKDVRQIYSKKCDELTQKICDKNQTDDNRIMYEKLANKVLEIIVKLNKSTDKDHVMKEARELFYDPDMHFLNLLDSNPMLMCFKNGVLDISNRVFRDGRPEDYLEKCTGIDYRPLDRTRDAKTINEINDFMSKLFPREDLRKYMWEHLASLIMGVNLDQKLHIYIGGGENGKSVLCDLLKQCFGDYYDGSVPLSLVTQARQRQGSAAPDIVALKGIRVAVMQEPSKDDKLNDGSMKELTSGVEPIRGRPLFGNIVEFIPQFKIIICSNNFPKVNSQDHGTWRRLNVVDFESLFTHNPDSEDPDKPFQYKKDTKLKDKFSDWRVVFMSMLVEIVLKSQGNVTECKRVAKSSQQYREREDNIAEYIRERIIRDDNGRIQKSEINADFTTWFQGTYGRGGPSNKEVHEYLDRHIGKHSTKNRGWIGWRIRYDNDDDGDQDDDGLENEINAIANVCEENM